MKLKELELNKKFKLVDIRNGLFTSIYRKDSNSFKNHCLVEDVNIPGDVFAMNSETEITEINK